MRRLATLILSLWGIALSHAALEVPKALPATDIKWKIAGQKQ